MIPALESNGLNLLLPQGRYEELRLFDFKDLGGGIVQLYYAAIR